MKHRLLGTIGIGLTVVAAGSAAVARSAGTGMGHGGPT